MFPAVPFRVLAISETTRLGSLTRTGLLETVVTTSDLEKSVGKTKAQCSVESSSVVIATSMLAWNDIEEF